MLKPVTWKDLTYWKSSNWTEMQEYLDSHNDYLPAKGKIFRALTTTPLSEVRCVILGQDPYPSVGMATGLAFSIGQQVRQLPPTLRNIFGEYAEDTHYPYPVNGDLTPWAERGVLLWNTCLTVRQGQSGSHSLLGWDTLTAEVIYTVLQNNPRTGFILWGKHAQDAVGKFSIRNKVETVHPSPLSAHKGFFGSRPFTRLNLLLSASNEAPIDWRLP